MYDVRGEGGEGKRRVIYAVLFLNLIRSVSIVCQRFFPPSVWNWKTLENTPAPVKRCDVAWAVTSGRGKAISDFAIATGCEMIRPFRATPPSRPTAAERFAHTLFRSRTIEVVFETRRRRRIAGIIIIVIILPGPDYTWDMHTPCMRVCVVYRFRWPERKRERDVGSRVPRGVWRHVARRQTDGRRNFRGDYFRFARSASPNVRTSRLP